MPVPGLMNHDHKYRTPSTIEGPSSTVPPLSKLHRTLPVAPSSAYMEPDCEPAYITPLATLTDPASIAPMVGSGVCQINLPVKTSSADQAPQVICCPPGTSV